MYYKGEAFVRILAYVFLTKLGRIIFGILLLIAGLVYGFNSHAVMYADKNLKQFNLYTSNNLKYYIQDPATNTFYTINLTDFSAYFSDQEMKEHQISFIYNASPDTMDFKANNDEIKRQSYHVVKLTIFDATNQTSENFATYQYIEHPHSYYENYWANASIIVGLGLLFILFSLLAPMVVETIIRQRNGGVLPDISEQEMGRIYAKQQSAHEASWKKGNVKRHFQEPPDFKKWAK